MGDIGIQVTVETPNGEEVIRLARPDLLDMDAINEKYEEWQALSSKLEEGETPSGFFKDINDFLVKYAPALCYTHVIAPLDGGEVPKDADFYIVASADVKLTPDVIRKRLDVVALMAMFMGIMESVASIGTAVKEGADEAEPFRGPSVRGRGGPPGGADEPAAE